MEERRKVKRIDIFLKGLFFYEGLEHKVETKDISSIGAFLISETIPPMGEVLSMELTVAEKTIEHKVYLLAKVVRILSQKEKEKGFAVQWIEATSYETIEPLRIFLKAIIGFQTGFIQALNPEEAQGRKKFCFKFPEIVSPLWEKAETKVELKKLEETPPELELKPQEIIPTLKEPPRKTTTELYISLPLTYSFEGKEYEGYAIKLTETGLKIDTEELLPDLYKRIVIKILLHGKEKKKSFLQLNGSVTLIKPRNIHARKGGQIEVELTLVNDPQTMNVYRSIVHKLREASIS